MTQEEQSLRCSSLRWGQEARREERWLGAGSLRAVARLILPFLLGWFRLSLARWEQGRREVRWPGDRLQSLRSASRTLGCTRAASWGPDKVPRLARRRRNPSWEDRSQVGE